MNTLPPRCGCSNAVCPNQAAAIIVSTVSSNSLLAPLVATALGTFIVATAAKLITTDRTLPQTLAIGGGMLALVYVQQNYDYETFCSHVGDWRIMANFCPPPSDNDVVGDTNMPDFQNTQI